MLDPLVDRLKDSIGPAAATSVAEDDGARRFLPELTFTAVAIYLAMKYIDGFIDGIGLPDLGKRHGASVKRSLGELLDIVRHADVVTREDTATKLGNEAEKLSTLRAELLPHAAETTARQAGEKDVQETLEERGLPANAARRIAHGVDAAIWTG